MIAYKKAFFYITINLYFILNMHLGINKYNFDVKVFMINTHKETHFRLNTLFLPNYELVNISQNYMNQ